MTLINRLGNFLAINLRKSKLKNHSFSLISNNCIGGFMMHGVKEQFRSPTVNLVIQEDQFCTFCKHLKEYSECPLEERILEKQPCYKGTPYPVGILRGEEFGIPDITILFMHYHSFAQAKQTWEKRFQRVNYDDIFIVFNRDMEAKEETLDEFQTIPYEHKVFITHHKDPERWKNTFSLSCFDSNYHTGDLYNRHWIGPVAFFNFDEFDYVSWLNSGEIKQRKGWR